MSERYTGECPFDDCKHAFLEASRAAVHRHLRAAHGVTLADGPPDLDAEEDDYAFHLADSADELAAYLRHRVRAGDDE